MQTASAPEQKDIVWLDLRNLGIVVKRWETATPEERYDYVMTEIVTNLLCKQFRPPAEVFDLLRNCRAGMNPAEALKMLDWLEPRMEAIAKLGNECQDERALLLGAACGFNDLTK